MSKLVETHCRAQAKTNICCIVFSTEEGDEGEAVPAPQMRTAA